MRARSATATVLSVLFSVACGAQESTSPGSTVRDSAGIAIVDDAAPRLDSVHAWRLSEQPIVDIGGPDATGPYALYQVTSVARMVDGRIVAVDGGSAEVRYFDADGTYLTKAGGRGDGPGEFRFIGTIKSLPGDTLAAYDPLSRRVTFFGPDAKLARVEEVPAVEAAGGFTLLGRLADGTLVLSGGKNAMYLGQGDGLHWGQGWIFKVPGDDAASSRILEFESPETLVAQGGRASAAGPFLRSRRPVLAGDHVILADNTDYELRYFDLEGRLRRIARRAYEPRPVTAEDVDTFTAHFAHTPLKALWDGVTPPATWPTFFGAMADRAGNVWIESKRPFPGEGPVTWSVFDADGEWVTDITTPDGYRITDIGADWVLGVWMDDMTVEHVRMFGLIRR